MADEINKLSLYISENYKVNGTINTTIDIIQIIK